MKHYRLIPLFLLFAISVLAKDRFVGGDISMLPKYEAANVKYSDVNGNKIPDLIKYFRDEAGFNVARVRLFVNPKKGITGVVQDLDYVISLSKRIKDKGLKLMLDFHYSDTWADPTNQWIPAEWVALSTNNLYQKIYDYTKDVLQQLVAAGAAPDFIQTGNEISYGMLWGEEGKQIYRCYPTKDGNWPRFISLLTRAGEACREVCPDAKIIIHTERTNNWTATKDIYERLADLDYDIIGLSYYPEWHNSLSSLSNMLQNINNTFPDKPVMIVETGYFNNWYNTKATYDFTSVWPASAAGQKAFLDDLVNTIKDFDFLEGVLYWFPEENPYNNHVYEPWYNHGLFNPNNGKVSEALFSLKALRDFSDDSAVMQNSIAEPQVSGIVYTIDGRAVDANNLQPGIYITNGRKIIVCQ